MAIEISCKSKLITLCINQLHLEETIMFRDSDMIYSVHVNPARARDTSEDYWHTRFKVQAQVYCPFSYRDINVVQDTIVYHNRDVNEYINYELVDVM